MSKSNRTAGCNFFRATLVAAALSGAAIAGMGPARAAAACALVPNDRAQSEKILQCGEALTVRPAEGARYQPFYRKRDPLRRESVSTMARCSSNIIRRVPREKFQILTPLAIAAVRGTKWAMEVTPAKTSALVLAGSVAVTNRRLNQSVVLTEGQGVDITPADTSVVQKQWGEARVRALLSRFGE